MIKQPKGPIHLKSLKNYQSKLHFEDLFITRFCMCAQSKFRHEFFQRVATVSTGIMVKLSQSESNRKFMGNCETRNTKMESFFYEKLEKMVKI